MAAETEGGTTPGWKTLRDGAGRLALPIFATVVSAVLIANFVSSREDAQHLQRERDLQTKALIANDMSEAAVKVIFAAETGTKELVRSGGANRPSSDAVSSSLEDFYARSLFIRAKLQAYYKNESLATWWSRYTNGVGAFLDLGAGASAGERPKSLLGEIRAGFDANSKVNAKSYASLARVDTQKLEVQVAKLEQKDRSHYLSNYLLLGKALIDRGAELTRQALD